jgi:hypothetical protein
MNLIEKERAIERHEIGTAVLLGPSKAHILAIAFHAADPAHVSQLLSDHPNNRIGLPR